MVITYVGYLKSYFITRYVYTNHLNTLNKNIKGNILISILAICFHTRYSILYFKLYNKNCVKLRNIYRKLYVNKLCIDILLNRIGLFVLS